MASFHCITAAFLARGLGTLPTAFSFVSKQQRCPSVSKAAWRQHRSCRNGPRPSRRLYTGLAALDVADAEGVVPITLLTGFLGSGKTTTLQHLLENKDGLKIGVIVNDVASVNIDSKLVKKSDSSDDDAGSSLTDGVVELQNGCACCSLADELLPTIENLLDTKKSKDSDAEGFDALVVELSGVGDPIAVKNSWMMSRAEGKPVTKRADMGRVVTLVDASTFGTDFMSWETAGDRDGWAPEDDCSAVRKVPELLAEQIEAADVMVMNKIDLAGPKQLEVASTLARSINKDAILEEVEFGKVATPHQIIRDIAPAAKEEEESSDCCSNPECSSHSHASHSHESGAAPNDEDASPVAAAAEKVDADDDHSHSHSHSHDDHAMAANHLGIVNFVFKADRPFDTRKLMQLLHTWPVPIKDELDGFDFEPETVEAGESPFFGVLRSKGFCWLAPTSWDPQQGDQWRHDTAMYWSHAGKHFGISMAGKWWATLPRENMEEFFKNDPKELDRITKEDFVSEVWGDRRQELVFIGVNIDEESITEALNECLVTERGMELYTYQLNSLLY